MKIKTYNCKRSHKEAIFLNDWSENAVRHAFDGFSDVVLRAYQDHSSQKEGNSQLVVEFEREVLYDRLVQGYPHSRP